VGRGMLASKAASPLALYRPLMADRSSVKEESKSQSVRTSIELKEVSTTGGLSKEDLEKIVKQQVPSLELCYRKVLEKKPDLKGEIILQLVIDSNGKVKKANLVSSKLKDKKLENCMVQKIKQWIFPLTENKRNVTLTVILNLKSS
jgi:hypothetical protein